MQSCVRKYSFIKTRRKKNKCHFLRIFFSILFCVDFLYAWFYGLLVLFFTNHRRFSVCFVLDILWVLQSVSISCLYMPTRITNKTWSTLHFRWVMSQWFQHISFLFFNFFPHKKQGWYAFYIVCESCFIWTRKTILCHLSHDRIKKKSFCTRGLYRV